jgi:hypothetical protein
MHRLLSLLLTSLATVPVVHASQSHAYYPIATGDSWEYESSIRGRFSNEVLSVEGSVARIRSTNASGRTTEFDVEVRGDSVLLRPGSETAGLLVDFGAPLGSSYIGSAGPSAEIITFKAEHERLELSGIVFEHVREYQHRAEAGVTYTSYYAQGIGLVGMRWDSGPSVHLVSADVGGRSVTRE